jgi:diguanylate cyclase (GGDEF)-like protein
MNSAARTARARRGRLLIVGESAELNAALSQLLSSRRAGSSTAVKVENVFEALGEIANATAGAPIATVIIPDHFITAESSRAVEAIRKVDPSLRLVLLGADLSPEQWASRGFDDYLSSPLSPIDLARFLDDEALVIGTANGEQNTDGPGKAADNNGHPQTQRRLAAISLDELRLRLASASAPQLRIEVEADEEQADRESDESLAAPAQSGKSEAAQPDQTPTSSQLTQGLGDSDLVDAVLSCAGNARELALRIIHQHTGWKDLDIVDGPPASAGENICAGVELTWEGRRFGWLRSSAASVHQLQSWAQWISRWLALDEIYREHRILAHQDDLTGAWNRRFFEAFLAQAIHHASKLRRPVTVMVFDLDNFKSYNDEFGHEAGDEILRETVKLLNSVIRQGDRVCRIGGDEFAVIFADTEAPRLPGSTHPESVDVIARRFQDQVCKMRFPKLSEQAPGTLSISAGLATFPWDGSDPQTLLRRADQLALESKRKGKNAITLGRGTAEVCRRSPDDPPS